MHFTIISFLFLFDFEFGLKYNFFMTPKETLQASQAGEVRVEQVLIALKPLSS